MRPPVSATESTTLELKIVTKLDESSICDARSVDNNVDTHDVKEELDCGLRQAVIPANRM